ncbi:RolB family protein [Agrobacterium vitis]|uniref:RolB family protein n=1 Tax=Agrobacterium vitis TaxID=373 RepID=UPI0012EA8600|nr:RolB family protein [Agrobacterium vitis]MUO73537.1 hypothetical protein [Agrobacterium vitis]
MTVANWQVRDFTRILNAGELQGRLEQARTDFGALLAEIVYFHPPGATPEEGDDEYILTGQGLVYVSLSEQTARQCALNRLLPSNSSNFGTVVTAIPPWLMDTQTLNLTLQERCDQGGIVNYYHGSRTNEFFLAIMLSNCFVRFGTDEINGASYGFYARRGNYTEEGEDDDNEIGDEGEAGGAEIRDYQFGDLVNYPIVALGSSRLSA